MEGSREGLRRNPRERKRKQAQKVLGFKSSAPDSGTPDDLGHVTLPSVPSVWPVNIPLTPVKTWHSSFLTHRGAAVVTPSEPDRETQTERERRAASDGESGERNHEAEGGEWERYSTGKKGSDLFFNSPSLWADIVINVLLPGWPLELQ